MCYYLNVSIHEAMHYWHEWRISGARARMIPMGAGRWMVAKLIR